MKTLKYDTSPDLENAHLIKKRDLTKQLYFNPIK